MGPDLQWWIQLLLLAIPAWVAARYYHKQVQLMKEDEAQKTIFPKEKTWRRQIPFVLMGVLLLANWIPRLIKPIPTIGNCKTLLTGWGVSGPRLSVTVDTDVLAEKTKTTSRLMFIGRPADHTIDGKRDTGIVKSGSFGINGGPLQIDAMANDDFLKRAGNSGNWVEFHVVVIPKDAYPDKITSLEDVDKAGGRDVESRNFLLPVVQIVSPGQKPAVLPY